MPHKLSDATSNDLLQKLDSINCPFTCDIASEHIGEVLFEPHEHRIQILVWLLSKLDPSIEGMITSAESMSNTKKNLQVEPRIQVLTSLAATLCLCRPVEFDVIRGYAPTKRQLIFWRVLIDMVANIDSENNYSDVIDRFFEQDPNSGHTLFQKITEPVSLLPPDIKKALHIAEKVVNMDKIKASKLTDLEIELETCKNKLIAEQEILQKMEKDATYIEKDDPVSVETTLKSLKLNLVDLDQILDAFCQIYMNNYAPLCKKQSQKFSDLGEKINSINSLLSRLMKTLDNLKEISKNHEIILLIRNKLENTINMTNKLELNTSKCLENLCVGSHSLSKTGTYNETLSRDYDDTSSRVIMGSKFMSNNSNSVSIKDSYTESNLHHTLANMTEIQ